MALIDDDTLNKVQKCGNNLCLALQNEDKVARKQALKNFENFLASNNEETQENFHEIFKLVHIHLLNTLRDKIEAVREQSVNCLKLYILKVLPKNDYYLSYLFPIFIERIGSVEIIEESEEIRLQLVKFLCEIIDTYADANCLAQFLNDFVIILKETVQDKFPDIKEASCECIMKLAAALPRDFHMQSENLVKPVLTAFGHQRYKIRLIAIKCMGDVVQHSPYKALEEVTGPMAERLFDPIAKVRQMVQQVASRWLLQYRDRYSFFYKLLPLLLTGLNDEIEETRLHAHGLWLEVGLQYQQENEKDLKDQLDYLLEAPKNYPKDLARPNLGCRVLVQRNVGRLIHPISRELLSWQVDVRIRCSQLLCAIALHAEGGLTQYLQDILSALYAGAKDDEPAVVANIIRASEIMALFVPLDTWKKLIMPTLEDSPHYGHLAILAAFIRSTTHDNLNCSIPEFCKALAHKNICYSRKGKYQIELINCAKALQAQHDGYEPNVVGSCLFNIYLTVLSIKDKDNVAIDLSLLGGLQRKMQFPNVDALWGAYVEQLLFEIGSDPKSWTVTTIERCIFDNILFNCGESFGDNLPVICEILVRALDPDADAEARLQTFVALSSAFQNKDVIFAKATNLSLFLERIVADVLVPSLVWHAGRTSEAMRTIAASCLCCALNPGIEVDIFATKENIRKIFKQLSPLLLSLTEDASYRSRYLAMEDLALIKQELVKKNDWSDDDLITIYPEIVKRLDDPTDQVRVCAIKSLGKILEDAPTEFKRDTYKAHHELLMDTLLTHFDDDDEEFQALVLDVLKVMVVISKEIVKDKVVKHKPLIRNQIGCDLVLDYLKSF